MQRRERMQRTLLFLAFLSFPITLNYYSPYLIIEGSAQGIMTASFFFYAFLLVASLVVGRAVCANWCPLAGIQQCWDSVRRKKLVRKKYLPITKYVIWAAWISGIVFAAVSTGGYKRADLLYNKPTGISVDGIQGLITYFGIVAIVSIPVLLLGNRGFCHYFCPFGVFGIIGTKLRNLFQWPALHLDSGTGCQQCGTCDRACSKSIPVSARVAAGNMHHTECILCGHCVDACPNKVMRLGFGKKSKQRPKVSLPA